MFFFVTDLHQSSARYKKLLSAIRAERPRAVFLGGDLLSISAAPEPAGFLAGRFLPMLRTLQLQMGQACPQFFMILGNDDPRSEEITLIRAHEEGLCHYMHKRHQDLDSFEVYGLSYVPPTPFRLKDWEMYDVSRYVDPGCISPEEGVRTVPLAQNEIKWKTIQSELSLLAGDNSMQNAIFLFHVPPYDTGLDRANLDGRQFEGVDIDPHVGSIAVRRFIEERQPLVTLHGHVHESTRLTGNWKTRIGRTVCINGAHDGPELALVRFDPLCPANATRELI